LPADIHLTYTLRNILHDLVLRFVLLEKKLELLNPLYILLV
jgi:hypothetical protein